MNEVIGEMLPLAVGVAISPVPIIAVILMLFSPRAKSAGLGYLIGWVTGIAAVTAIFGWLAGTAGLGAGGNSPTAGAWIRLVLGILLVILAARQWRQRPTTGRQAVLPKWMSALDTITAVKAAGLGAALSVLNPKNLAMCAAAGVAMGSTDLSTTHKALAIGVFTLLASATVAIPVVAFLAAETRVRGPLHTAKTWLQQNNATVMSVLLLTIGVSLIGKGIAGIG